MQKIGTHFRRYVYMLIVMCILFVDAANVKGLFREDVVPPRVNEVNDDANAGKIFNALRQRVTQPISARQSDGLRYTITAVRPSFVAPTVLNESTLIAQAQDDASTYVNNDSELPWLISTKANNILHTLQRSGIVDSIMKFLAPNRQQNIRQHDLEKRDDPINELPQHDKPYSNPAFSSSIDAHPESVFNSQMEDNEMGSALDWKHTLFGPTGMFTEIFNIINEKRKEDERQRANLAAAAAAAVASAAKTHADPAEPSDLSADFTKIIEAFLSKTQSGNFDEPPPEIPFLGICDRLSCGDIYKAFDEFRKSELFTNFQTAISLLHDQKGWDIIGEMLANPELIDNFTGGGGGATSVSGKTALIGKSASASVDNGAVLESTDDDNIGIDFSKMVDERPSGGTKVVEKLRGRPHDVFDKNVLKIAENVDYYTSVDKGTVEERISKLASVPSTIKVHTSNGSMAQRPKINEMPEIAESVDEYPDSMTDNVDVEETVPISNVFKSVDSQSVVINISDKSIVSASGSPTAAFTTNKSHERMPATLVAKVYGGNGSRIIGEASSGAVVRVPPAPSELTNFRGVTRHPETRQMLSRTTKRNFRRFNDYYSMYYDGGT